MLTTDQKGAIAESAIAAAAIKLGIGVSRPVSPLRYDLVFDTGRRLLRVQCKWAVRKGDVVVVRCYTSRRTATGLDRRPYAAGEVDLLARLLRRARRLLGRPCGPDRRTPAHPAAACARPE